MCINYIRTTYFAEPRCMPYIILRNIHVLYSIGLIWYVIMSHSNQERYLPYICYGPTFLTEAQLQNVHV